jgi:hypothetical protein
MSRIGALSLMGINGLLNPEVTPLPCGADNVVAYQPMRFEQLQV